MELLVWDWGQGRLVGWILSIRPSNERMKSVWIIDVYRWLKGKIIHWARDVLHLWGVLTRYQAMKPQQSPCSAGTSFELRSIDQINEQAYSVHLDCFDQPKKMHWKTFKTLISVCTDSMMAFSFPLERAKYVSGIAMKICCWQQSPTCHNNAYQMSWTFRIWHRNFSFIDSPIHLFNG